MLILLSPLIRMRCFAVLLAVFLGSVSVAIADNSQLNLPVTSTTRFGNLFLDFTNPRFELYSTNDGRVEYNSQELSLLEGEVFRLVGQGPSSGRRVFNIKFQEGDWIEWRSLTFSGADVISNNDLLGPCTVKMVHYEVSHIKEPANPTQVEFGGFYFSDQSLNPAPFQQYAIFKTDATSTTVSATSNGEIVIPSSLKGEVSVVLEKSTDLNSWQEVPTGKFSPEESDVFFRIKATHSLPDSE